MVVPGQTERTAKEEGSSERGRVVIGRVVSGNYHDIREVITLRRNVVV